jgi:hypothetical protein
MTVLRAAFSAEFLGPDAGLSRSVSLVLTLPCQLRSAVFSVNFCYRRKADIFLRACWFRRSERRHPWKNTIQSP